MNPKRILVALFLAFLVSGLCTWAVSRRMTAPAGSQTAATVRYLVPSRQLQAGEVLASGNTELRVWPGSEPIEGAVSQLTAVNGREVLFPLAKGQPILDRDLASAGSGTGLAGRIPDGMRAVALRSDEIVGVAGFLLPGSHVDVLVTYRSDRFPDPLTATVLNDVVVLATGHQIEPQPQGKTTDTTVVTLLLTPDQSQRAVLASTQGAIHFVLRNGSDTGRFEEPPTLLSQLAGPTPAVERPAIRPAASLASAAPRRPEIEVILGDARAAPGQDRGVGQ